MLLLPISVNVRGTADLDKQVMCLTFRLFRIKILSVKLYFAPDGIYCSLNGKPGKLIRSKEEEKGKKRLKVNPFAAIKIRFLDLSFAMGGDPLTLSYVLGSIMTTLDSVLSYLQLKQILDRAKVRVVPRFTGSVATVNFSIRLFTSLSMILAAFTHTTRGDNDEGRIDREYDG